jgi:hypothetical protein
MTYEKCLEDLKAINLKNKFIADFESIDKNKNLILMLKNTDKIFSAGSLIRTLIASLEYQSEKYFFWVEAYQFFITPEFERKSKYF